jgi:hypothetical protein
LGLICPVKSLIFVAVSPQARVSAKVQPPAITCNFAPSGDAMGTAPPDFNAEVRKRRKEDFLHFSLLPRRSALAKAGHRRLPGPFFPAKFQRTGARAPHRIHITTF